MRFNLFLHSEVAGTTPIERIKNDLAHYKAIFSYAPKTDMLYNNLIDNIFWLLELKFGRFAFRYTRYETCYGELNLIISSQMPQFLLIQKKQLAEQLELFGELKNWGKSNIEKIARTITGTDSLSAETGFTPIDANQTDPYSKEQNNRTNTGEENVTNEKQMNDFLDFYSKVKWDVGSIDLDSILRPYYGLFLSIQTEQAEDDLTFSEYEELNLKIGDNTNLINDNTHLISQNLAKINTNKSDISTNATNIANLTRDKANSNEVVKLSGNQTVSGTKTFNGTIIVPNPNGNQQAANKQYVDNYSYPKNQTYNKTESNNLLNNKANVGDVYTRSQVYTKGEVDNKDTTINNRFSNYYTKSESDAKYLSGSGYVTTNTSQTISARKNFSDGITTNYIYSPSSSSNYVYVDTSYIALRARDYIDMNSKRVTKVANPTQRDDAATKEYVDNKYQSFVFNATVRSKTSIGNRYLYEFGADSYDWPELNSMIIRYNSKDYAIVFNERNGYFTIIGDGTFSVGSSYRLTYTQYRV